MSPRTSAARALARRYGLQVVRQKKHFVCRHPLGFQITLSQSASDPRALRNAEADIRRHIRAAQGTYPLTDPQPAP